MSVDPNNPLNDAENRPAETSEEVSPSVPETPAEEPVENQGEQTDEAPADEASADEDGPEVASDTPPSADPPGGADEPTADEADETHLNDEEEEAEEEVPEMDWYILKVQNNREDTIREALERRIKVAGLDHYFGTIIVPTERVTEFKGGKRRVVNRKLYPGYIVVQMAINDDTWFLVRETPGVGDFTGAIGRPTPMLPHEVSRILALTSEEQSEEQPKLQIGCSIGDRVKINEGNFANFEGEVSAIDEANGRVTVMINIFGRSTPVELGYWQIENL